LWECQEKEAANIPGMNLIEAWRQVYNKKASGCCRKRSGGRMWCEERISSLKLYFKRSGKTCRSEMGRCGKWRMRKLIMG
jgi:hypothetical protein